AGRAAGQELLDQAVDAGPALPVVGGAPWYEVGAQLREALSALTNFLADAVANAAEIAKVDSVDGQQLLDGVDAHMVENITRLHAVTGIGDAAAPIESPGDQLDTV